MVRHLLPRARRMGPETLGRSPVGDASQLLRNVGGVPKGNCLWCGQRVGRGQRTWHNTCVVWHSITRGQRRSVGGQWVVKPQSCPCGQPAQELDHHTPVMLAARRGIRSYVRAFLPENLQWLCRECHRRKTKEDAAAIARVKRLAQGRQQLQAWTQ